MVRIGVVGIPGRWSSEALVDAVEARTGFRCLIDMQKLVLDLASGSVRCDGVELTGLDGLMVKKVSQAYSPDVLDRLDMLQYVRERGVRVFSEPASMKLLIDRLTGTLKLRAGGIPMPATVVTESLDEAVDAVRRLGSVVAKPLFTSKARGMRVIDDGPGLFSALRAFRDAGNPVLYLQQRVELTTGRDLGVAFLGGEYLGTYARVRRRGAWSTTTTSGGRYEACDPGPAIVALAGRAQGLFDLAFTCVDVVETPAGPQVFEVSAFGGFRGLRDACDLDVASLYVEHVLRELGHG